VKPLHVIGTQRHVGKTTLILGLIEAFRRRGLKAAYIKPLGQHFKTGPKGAIHDDARVVAGFLGCDDTKMIEMAMPLPAGWVESQLGNLQTKERLDKVAAGCDALAADNDLVVIEAMGNVAMGSCLGMSAAEVAVRIGARSLLVAAAGIGRTIDEIALCATFINARGADLMGVVVNKAWPDKYTRIAKATTLGLGNLGIKTFGTLPFQEDLASPKMSQVAEFLHGEALGGENHMGHRVSQTIVAAMQPENMVKHIKQRTLVIAPGDRLDTIRACLKIHMLRGEETQTVAGLVLTCGYRPDEQTLKLIRESHLPVVLVEADTYTIASDLKQKIFKITPDDKERIDFAVRLVAEYVDVDGILNALK